MDSEKTILADLADGDVWSGWLREAQSWASEYVLTFDTLAELSLIVLAASLAWPISSLLRRKLQQQGAKYDRFALLRRLWSTLTKLAFPMVWLVVQWIAVAIMAYLEYRHAALVVTLVS